MGPEANMSDKQNVGVFIMWHMHTSSIYTTRCASSMLILEKARNQEENNRVYNFRSTHDHLTETKKKKSFIFC